MDSKRSEVIIGNCGHEQLVSKTFQFSSWLVSVAFDISSVFMLFFWVKCYVVFIYLLL